MPTSNSTIMTLSTSAQPKEKKRRNSEKRKLKSRNAARTRREKETAIFYELAHQLPMPHSMCAQLDKAGIMRLILSYLKVQNFTPTAIKSEPMDLDEDAPVTAEQLIDNYYLKALDGFAMMLSQEGDVIFISENVSQYIGLKQIDLIGQSIYDFSHPCDHEEIREHLSDHPWMGQSHSTKAAKRQHQEKHSFLMRMKCTLTAKGKIVTLKAATYKAMDCNGILKVSPSVVTSNGYRLPQLSCLSLIAMPIHHPANIEIPMDEQTFLTRHSMDMKFTYCDDRIQDLLGYDPEDLVDQSFYDFYHALDNHTIDKFHKDLFAKGQATSGRFRFLAKKSGYAWMETQATIIYNNKTNKPQCVVCINYMISGIEDEDVVIATHQLDEAMQMSTEKTFMPRPDGMDDDEFPLYLTGSKSNVVNAEDLTYLAPTAGNAMVPLDFPSPPVPITESDHIPKPEMDGQQEFVPFFPFVPLTPSADEKQTSDGGGMTNQESPARKVVTPDLILPDKNSPMSSSKDPLMLDCTTEAGGQLHADDLSMRAPYISMSDDLDFGGDKLMVDTQLAETWEPVDLFGNMNSNGYMDSVISPSYKDQKQELLSPSSGALTAPSTPYSPQSRSPFSPQSVMSPVNKLCQSLPNLWLARDDDHPGPTSATGQPTSYWDTNKSPPPLLPMSPQTCSPLVSPAGRPASTENYSSFSSGKHPPRPEVQQALKRKLETRSNKRARQYKVARLNDGGTDLGGGNSPGGRGGGRGWSVSKGGLELDALQPPGRGKDISSLQSLLLQPAGRSINNHFGHSLLLQKVAQQVVNKQVGSGGTNKADASKSLLSVSGGQEHFPLFQAQPSPGDAEDGLVDSNNLLSCLPLITRQDLDVNTPLQASAGLLQGEELLRALDVP
ncbi:hypoxia-inducible factor 1-alpha-like [Acanthaster planci]|uniref:Hypoxia-inducible factor 1-alpha-like n=1 Tax=Acanthaster planci TaxID=133434 RepID=A0A8B7Z3M0_ACAPL|nr:hypoxia-inducible factor 1-alpha-like [Acanthaster planci]